MKHKIILDEHDVREIIYTYIKKNNQNIITDIQNIKLNVGLEYLGQQYNENRVPVFKNATVELEYKQEDWPSGKAAGC